MSIMPIQPPTAPGSTGTIDESQVAPVWGDANNIVTAANNIIAASQSYISELVNNANAIPYPILNVKFPVVDAQPKLIEASAPTILPLEFDEPTQLPAFSGGVDITGLIPGPVTINPPTLNFRSQPQPTYGSPPPSPAVDLNFTYPAINVNFPNPPNLLTIDTITFNPLVIPTFTESPPVLNVGVPSPIPYVEGAFYASTELSLVQSSLSSAILNGTDTGLDATTGKATLPAIRATTTLAIGYPKIGLLKPYAKQLVGELLVADVGIPPVAWRNYQLTTLPDFGGNAYVAWQNE